jgi:hypothetical protein
MQNTSTQPVRRVRWGIIVAIAAGHFVLGFFALLVSFGDSMDRFESAAPPSLFMRLMSSLADILHFPIVTYWPFNTPGGLSGYFIFALNSLFWAICIYAIGCFVLRRIHRV